MCPKPSKRINFDAVDFSDCCSQQVTSFFGLTMHKDLWPWGLENVKSMKWKMEMENIQKKKVLIHNL